MRALKKNIFFDDFRVRNGVKKRPPRKRRKSDAKNAKKMSLKCPRSSRRVPRAPPRLPKLCPKSMKIRPRRASEAVLGAKSRPGGLQGCLRVPRVPKIHQNFVKKSMRKFAYARKQTSQKKCAQRSHAMNFRCKIKCNFHVKLLSAADWAYAHLD